VLPPGAGEFLPVGVRKKTTDNFICSLSVTPSELLTPPVLRAYLLVIPPGAGEFLPCSFQCELLTPPGAYLLVLGEFLPVGVRKKTTDIIACSLSVTPEGFKPTTFRTGI
jgi:hypothetical protein